MRYTRIFMTVTLILATLAAGLPYLRSGEIIWALVLLGLGLFWGSTALLRIEHWLPPTLGFSGYVIFSAVGLLLGLGRLELLLAVVAALMAWDLQGFQHRLARAAAQATEAEDATTSAASAAAQAAAVERQHLLRLSLVAVTGAGLGALTMLVQINLHFGVMLLLALLAIVGLRQAILYLRQETD